MVTVHADRTGPPLAADRGIVRKWYTKKEARGAIEMQSEWRRSPRQSGVDLFVGEKLLHATGSELASRVMRAQSSTGLTKLAIDPSLSRLLAVLLTHPVKAPGPGKGRGTGA